MRGGHSALNKIISSTITQGDETENNSGEEAILVCLGKASSDDDTGTKIGIT